MMRHAAYAFCAALCVAGFATAAHADPVVTYTWETLSSQYDDGRLPAPPLHLSFTADGPVNVSANSNFANTIIYEQFNNQYSIPPNPQVQYPFPPQLVNFNLDVGYLSIDLANFVSECSPKDEYCIPGLPQWNFGLSADPTNLTAGLSIFFLNFNDTDEIAGPAAQFTDAGASTGAVTTLGYYSDGLNGPALYTGQLVVTRATIPEPSSVLVLLAALGMLGLISRRAW